jgi:hypothetical protein
VAGCEVRPQQHSGYGAIDPLLVHAAKEGHLWLTPSDDSRSPQFVRGSARDVRKIVVTDATRLFAIAAQNKCLG